MNNLLPEPSVPMRVRIASHVTQSRFLHVEDSLQLGKVRLYGGNYRRSAGASALAAHFLDIADARVVFDALARGEEGFAYKEYKGTPGKNGQPPVSRVLSVAVKGENVYVELKSGPGKLTPTGAVTPAGPAQVEVNVAFKRHEARRLAATVLAYLHAWDVVRMMAQRPVVGKVRPYELVPAEGMRNAECGTRNGENSSTPHSALATPHSLRPFLVYGDGQPVKAENVTEVQTFERFVVERKSPPASRAALLDYYRQAAV